MVALGPDRLMAPQGAMEGTPGVSRGVEPDEGRSVDSVELAAEDALVLGQSPNDLNRDIASMVKEITKIGPKVPEIARRLGRHKETVRYWYKKIEEHNFGIQAEMDQESMGLRRLVFTVRFGDAYVPYIKPLMMAMADMSYVVGYSRSMPGDTYVINATPPIERTDDYLDFFDQLRVQGIFTQAEPTVYDQFRNVPMRTDHYDFMRGRWEFDGQATEDAPVEFAPSPRRKLDKIDLLLAKELMIDATRELREIQRSIWDIDHVEINYKTLCWHLSEHLERNRLLRGYKVNWVGTQYDTKSRRDLRPQHTYTGSELFVKSPTAEEMNELRARMAGLPILYSEAVGRDYHAQVAIPNELMVETLEYLESAIKPVREKSEFIMVDMRYAQSFTLPYLMYEEESHTWQFNKENLLAKFAEFMIQVKNAH